MTSGVVLSLGGLSVDFNSTVANNVSITHRFANPVIKLPTPIKSTDDQGTNVIIINIGFLNDSFDLSFQLHDGPGSFTWKGATSASTAYEQIMAMAHDTNPKTLTLNGKGMPGHIENVNIPFRAGQKDLVVNGSLSFNLSKNITMGS